MKSEDCVGLALVGLLFVAASIGFAVGRASARCSADSADFRIAVRNGELAAGALDMNAQCLAMLGNRWRRPDEVQGR